MRDPLVFLPGVMCDARLFGPLLAALSCDIAVTVAPVTRGERVEEIASGLLDMLPRRFALAGHGMGGIVAMDLLRRAPERVARIALINSNPLAETPQSAAEYEPAIIKLRTGLIEDAIAALVPAGSLAPGTGRAHTQAVLSEMAHHLGAEAITRQLRALQRRRDYQAVLRRCKVPALLLCGEHEAPPVVKRHRFMADLIPYTALEVVAGAGHLPTLEAPEATLAALQRWFRQPLVLQTRADA